MQCMAAPLSIRLKEDTLQRLYFQAGLAGLPPRTLAQRMVEEALRSADHPGIEFADNGGSRRARIRGTGVEVWEMVDLVKLHGGDIDAVVAFTDRPRGQVEAALAYYGAFPDDIDLLVEANRRAAEEGRAALREGHERAAG